MLGLLACLLFSSVTVAQTKLLRFPDIHGDQVVFTYAGDLWTASTSGGMATRLTAHPGVELFAKFSPDGKWIAFTGQYDGDEQVYVIPADWRRSQAVDFLSVARPAARPLGLRQPGLRLDSRRQVCHLSLAARILRPWVTRGSTRFPSTAACPRLCPCPNPAPETSLPTAPNSSIRRSSATSAPGSATPAVGRSSSTSSTSSRTPRKKSPPICGPSRSYVDRRKDLLLCRHGRHQ